MATPANAARASAGPRNILMLKAHSAGIGDLLRSSAAWRALKNQYPQAGLHLWFLTKNPSSASRELISRHHLLASFHVTDKRSHPGGGWNVLQSDSQKLAAAVQPDLVVDFEPNGFRTSLLAWKLGRSTKAETVGIAQVPLRRFLYRQAAPSTHSYARQHGMSTPLEYAERDFVALAALGIQRKGTPIELRETDESRRFRERLLQEFAAEGGRPLLGLNIGCGTPDAVWKRPHLRLMAELARELQRRHGFALILTGATYEQQINKDFLKVFQQAGPVLDLAGRTNLLELTGVIAACRLFISSDSGPYHMAVGLRVPTLAVFNRPNPVHYHHHEWVICQVAGDEKAFSELVESAEKLIRRTPAVVVS
jgi:ADP-heptose:LPS heptosyltransferase